MADKLVEICNTKRGHIAQRKSVVSESDMIAKAKAQHPPRGFIASLRKKIDAGQFALIAEIKKASPSRGLIRADFDPASLAKSYARGGAAALSVLTDRPYFQGADEYLLQARGAASLPALRKDFMLDPYQIAESRTLGADAVLLIMAALSDDQAHELEAAALELKMDVLIEVHDAAELERALHLSSPLIGINNRDLRTLKVDLATCETLAKEIPAGKLCVGESGIATNADMARLKQSGISAFLVGESLMVQRDVEAATRQLLGGI